MRICLISSVHLWVNPRLIKEADWLASQGHDVHVVTKRVDPWSDARDDELLRGKRWSADRLNLLRGDVHGRRRWFTAAIRAAAAMRLHRLTGIVRFAEEGYYRGFAEVLSLAKRTRADFYIAHTQGALPIAARAAAASGVAFGFDCEDLLAEEAADGLTNAALRRAILQIERTYLPRAAYVTATSHAMAEYLERTYHIRPPYVVRNVFARAELANVVPPRDRPPRATIDLVWMSATIGEGRGIDQALDALARLPAHVRLTLVGRLLPAYESPLRVRIAALGIADRVTIRPPVKTAEIMSFLSGYDIGLTLDLNDCLNRSLTICNKAFLYLQAGLLVGATDTAGQRELIDAVPAAGFLCPPGDGAALARRIASFADDRAALAAAQDAAWRAGQQGCNWDTDALVFQSALDEAIASRRVADRGSSHVVQPAASR